MVFADLWPHPTNKQVLITRNSILLDYSSIVRNVGKVLIEYAKNQIAEQMYSEITKVQLAQVDSDVVQQMKATFEDQNVKQQSIDTLKKSAQFQNMTDNLSFDKLSDMMQNSKDTYRKLTSTQNQMKSQKAPIKQQPVRQKAVQQNQPQAGGIKK